MRVLLTGNDKLAAYLIDMLVENQHEVVFLNIRPESSDDLLVDEKAVTVVLSEGSLMGDLRHARADDMDLFLAFSNDDNSNAMAAQIASHIFHVPKVVCLIGDLRRSQVYSKLGLHVVSPNQALLDEVRAALQD